MTHSAPSSAASKSHTNTPLDIPIVHTLYQTYTFWSQLIIKFPKSQRYTLGEVCQQNLLMGLEAVITAASTPDARIKADHLRTASAKLDLMRLLVRLAKDTKCINNQAYLQLESQLHEAGRMLGGWLKSL